jgi:hypothetical protein
MSQPGLTGNDEEEPTSKRQKVVLVRIDTMHRVRTDTRLRDIDAREFFVYSFPPGISSLHRQRGLTPERAQATDSTD